MDSYESTVEKRARFTLWDPSFSQHIRTCMYYNEEDQTYYISRLRHISFCSGIMFLLLRFTHNIFFLINISRYRFLFDSHDTLCADSRKILYGGEEHLFYFILVVTKQH